MGKTLLLVEDEEGMRSYLTSELQFEDYTVLTATTGTEALAQYQAHKDALDLIILDWMLPELDGLEVMRRIRRHDDIPIIMMTARDYVGDKVAGLDNGADDYITKPFEIEEFLARLRVIMRRKDRGGRSPKSLQVGDLKLDLKSRQIQHGTIDDQLTQRECDLLQMLMTHAGQTLSREELLDSVWGTDYAGQTNIVDVYIRYLRGKLDETGHESIIRTVRGVGYVLEDPHHA